MHQGVDATGAKGLPNGRDGISLGTADTPYNGAKTNVIGGRAVGERNVISANKAGRQEWLTYSFDAAGNRETRY